MNTTRMGHDYMVRIPKFRLSEVIPNGSDEVHPAFKVNGKEINAIYVSKYLNTIFDGMAYSLPYQQSKTSLSFDDAVKACERKGAGWHLMSNAEWAAVALWSKAHGTMPHGNTNCGSYYYDSSEKGLTYGGNRTLTGSGPDTWTHDHTSDGICDLVGNVWEFVSGIRIAKGRIEVIPDNNIVARVDMSENSKEWKNLGYGFRFEDSEIYLTTDKKINKGRDGCRFKDLKSDIEVPEKLKALGLYPIDDKIGDDYFWVDTEEDERLVYRGGYWNSTSNAGVFYFSAFNPRSTVNNSIGFRSVFAELPTAD